MATLATTGMLARQTGFRETLGDTPDVVFVRVGLPAEMLAEGILRVDPLEFAPDAPRFIDFSEMAESGYERGAGKIRGGYQKGQCAGRQGHRRGGCAGTGLSYRQTLVDGSQPGSETAGSEPYRCKSCRGALWMVLIALGLYLVFR